MGNDTSASGGGGGAKIDVGEMIGVVNLLPWLTPNEITT